MSLKTHVVEIGIRITIQIERNKVNKKILDLAKLFLFIFLKIY